MIQDARLELSEHPWQVYIPCLALVFTILAFNTLGDGIRDALGLGMPKGKQRIKGRLGLTTVTRPADHARAAARPTGLLVGRRTCRWSSSPRPGPATVVDHVSFGVDAGEVVALVGESGSGKTVSSLAVMRLVASPPGRITCGLGDVRRPRPAVAVVQRDARGARRPRSRWCSRTR